MRTALCSAESLLGILLYEGNVLLCSTRKYHALLCRDVSPRRRRSSCSPACELSFCSSALELVLSSAGLSHLWTQMKPVFFVARLTPLVIHPAPELVLSGGSCWGSCSLASRLDRSSPELVLSVRKASSCTRDVVLVVDAFSGVKLSEVSHLHHACLRANATVGR